ncbi:MAG: hypothetical protein BWY38_01624 [Ignavibacteria bacterium ADurb.Bin266]|nr:MAG: hypothetical protein BWY38_01624 [Ignavibacteria bacterium ADurb.Bin266]
MKTYIYSKKLKFHKRGSELYSAWHSTPIFMVEVAEKRDSRTLTHNAQAFEHSGKTYCVIGSYLPERNFRIKFMEKWYNRNAWKGVYLRELKEI